jgi:hypothetical protein
VFWLCFAVSGVLGNLGTIGLIFDVFGAVLMVGAHLDSQSLERLVGWRNKRYQRIKRGVNRLQNGEKLSREKEPGDNAEFNVMAEIISGSPSEPYSEGAYNLDQFIGPVQEPEVEGAGDARSFGEYVALAEVESTFWIPYRINHGDNQYVRERIRRYEVVDRARREIENMYISAGARWLLLGFSLQVIGRFI